MQIDWILAAGIVLTSVLAATGGLLLMSALPGRSGIQRGSIFADSGQGAIFLFDGDTLIDATPGARALLATSHTRGAPYIKLIAYLSPHFPDLENRFARLPLDGSFVLTSEPAVGPPLILQAEQRGGLARVVLIDPESNERAPGTDPMAQRALNEELDLLRQTMAKAPVLVWREREDGEVIWANAAYLHRVGEQLAPGKDLHWPLPRLFDRTAVTQGAVGQRQRLTLASGAAAWFELVSFPEGTGHLVFAMPNDAAVNAENALRDFIQTLTKTFAHLPIGLAIFDQARQLQLFNPALLDLTGLPVDFLSMRPSLLSVLDAMRDRAMIPEPKDYRNWRRQMIDMERAAASGLYEETWSLPGGQTYRVIGRPHPNGAIALMIEDISNEMLRTRRYRADLELGQSVIDQIDEAIAVFSESGALVMSNAAYAAIWGHDPASGLGDSMLRSLCNHWRSLSAPSAIWAEIEDFGANLGDRIAWSAEVRLLDGRLLECRFAPLAGGATLACFRTARVNEAVAPVITSAMKSA
jgi:PAS domain-containing protein